MLLALTNFVVAACTIEVCRTFAAPSLLPVRLLQNPFAPEMLNAQLTAAKKKFANRMAFCASQPLYIMKGHHMTLR